MHYIITGYKVIHTYAYKFSQCCTVHWKTEFVSLMLIVSYCGMKTAIVLVLM